jgi:hypothetical protein
LGKTLIGPHIIGSNYLSSFTIGYKGSLNTHKGKAKLIVTFLYTEAGKFNKNLTIYTPTAPTTIAVVVAIAGMILPAISLTLKLSTYYIL